MKYTYDLETDVYNMAMEKMAGLFTENPFMEKVALSPALKARAIAARHGRLKNIWDSLSSTDRLPRGMTTGQFMKDLTPKLRNRVKDLGSKHVSKNVSPALQTQFFDDWVQRPYTFTKDAPTFMYGSPSRDDMASAMVDLKGSYRKLTGNYL